MLVVTLAFHFFKSSNRLQFQARICRICQKVLGFLSGEFVERGFAVRTIILYEFHDWLCNYFLHYA